MARVAIAENNDATISPNRRTASMSFVLSGSFFVLAAVMIAL